MGIKRSYLNLGYLIAAVVIWALVGCDSAPMGRSTAVVNEAGPAETITAPTVRPTSKPTLVPTARPTHPPTPLMTPTQTPTESFTTPAMTETSNMIPTTVEDIEEALYIHSETLFYAKYDAGLGREFNYLPDQEDPFKYIHRAGITFDSGMVDGPADAWHLSFANYSDKVAYWTSTGVGQLWISDLDLEQQRLAFTDHDAIFSGSRINQMIDLVWLPDDMHLIIQTDVQSAPNQIYHLQSSTIEDWPWECDQVAVSPKSDRLALWCHSQEHESQYAVIEWLGDIWFSETEPIDSNVIDTGKLGESWAWSSDGERVAYYDFDDPEGNLFILDSWGKKRALFPGSSNWDTTAFDDGLVYPPNSLIQWSTDGNRLLVFANELNPDGCPPYENPYGPEPRNTYNVPCFHVIEPDSGSVVWSWTDLVEKDALSPEETKHWQVWNGVISPDGKFLAFHIKPLGSSELAIIDLERDEIVIWGGGKAGNSLRWNGNP